MLKRPNDELDFNRAMTVHGLSRRQAGALLRLADRKRLHPYTGDQNPHGGLGLTGGWMGGIPHVTVARCSDGRWVQTQILRSAHLPEPDLYNTDDVPVGRGPFRAVSATSPDGLVARGARSYASPFDALRAALKAIGR